ncbi:Lar family restriction alleviation protein [Pseudomonas aeruginosa]
MAEELRPCPFCGGSDLEMQEPHQIDAVSWMSGVQCNSCEASLSPIHCETNPSAAQDEARICWNRRQSELVLAATVPVDLLNRCREILNWQSTGILKGEALRGFGRSRWSGDPNELQIAESETAREAYRFIDELARLSESPAGHVVVPRELVERAAAVLNGRLKQELRALLSEQA